MLQVCSVYSQLLQLFSRGQFARAVKHHQAERNAKGFSSWEQFVAMLFCQLAHLNSLREVCIGLASCESPLKHLGISTTPKKSTLAYANANRPCASNCSSSEICGLGSTLLWKDRLPRENSANSYRCR